MEQKIPGKLGVWALMLVLGMMIGAAPAMAQKAGGVLSATLRENPPSLSIHQESTISTVWPVMPIYNNLVIYDWKKAVEGPDTIVGELAESWSWDKTKTKLTFKLHKGVTWHDGKPFTSADVKFTFDLVRGASSVRMKTNPRDAYYANVKEIVTNGDHEVTFVLNRPQPGLLSIFATGYSPVTPAHIAPDDLRTTAVGTGPFKLQTFTPDQSLVLEKNPNYFRKGRPYLDGINFVIIKARPSRTAALQAGQVDIAFPTETNEAAYSTLKSAVPSMQFQKVAQAVGDNIIMNLKKAPFDNLKVRQAVSMAMDRSAMIKSVHQGLAVPGGANVPPPYGVWGLSVKELASLPGYGDPEKNKAQARKLLASLGYTKDKPLKVTVSTRAIAIYVDTASWAIDQLKQVGIEGTLEQIETGNWHSKITRGEYEMGINLTGVGPDDPDANFYENYSCESPRNVTFYCNPEVEKLFEQQSMETNPKKRLQLVHDIDKRLQMEVARPWMAHRLDYFAAHAYVKNLVAHHNAYNFGRMENVWLDK